MDMVYYVVVALMFVTVIETYITVVQARRIKECKQSYKDEIDKGRAQQAELLSLQDRLQKKQEEIISLHCDLCPLRQSFHTAVEQEIVNKVCSTRSKPQYKAVPILRDFHKIPLSNKRFMRAVTGKMRIRDFAASAQITSDSGNTYFTSLTQCSCMDFQKRGGFCKHMYRLAMEVGLLIGASAEYIEYLQNLSEREQKVEEEQKRLMPEKKAFKK